MFSIGDFASHGRVSVRVLRHYDVDRDALVTELQEPVATS